MQVDSPAAAMPPTSGLIVLSSTGTGALAASAMMSVGQKDVSMVNVNPQTGEPSIPTTPQQVMTPVEPSARLEISTPGMDRAMQGISTPEFKR